MAQHIQNIKVYFSDDGTELHPTVDNGFAIQIDTPGEEHTFILNFTWGPDPQNWMSPASTGNLTDYTISIDPIDPDFVYRIQNQTGNLIPLNGTGETEVQDTRIIIPGIPSGWAGLDFEYDIRITGNAAAGGRSGVLDPRGRVITGN
ncbi:MAG: hypothetical protein AAF212_05065 [Verrucomicrobiota bacterium]